MALTQAGIKKTNDSIDIKCLTTCSLWYAAKITLFAVALLGITGLAPDFVIALSVVGLAVGGIALSCCSSNLKGRGVQLFMGTLTAFMLVGIGALGGVGLLSGTSIGLGVLGTLTLSSALHCAEREKSCFNQTFL